MDQPDYNHDSLQVDDKWNPALCHVEAFDRCFLCIFSVLDQRSPRQQLYMNATCSAFSNRLQVYLDRVRAIDKPFAASTCDGLLIGDLCD